MLEDLDYITLRNFRCALFRNFIAFLFTRMEVYTYCASLKLPKCFDSIHEVFLIMLLLPECMLDHTICEVFATKCTL